MRSLTANPRAWSRTQVALAVLLVAGAALRVWLLASYRPGFVGYPDARAYIVAAHEALYFNQFKPVGYPLFLQLLHALDARLTFTIVVQHLLGLATAVILYAATAPYLTRRWLALLPAAVVLFGGAQLFLEHSVLSDAPFTFLVAAAVLCALRSRASARGVWWLAAVGAVLAIATTLRTVGMFLIPLAALWALTGPARPWRARLTAAAALIGAAAVVLLAYLIPQHAETGSWSTTRTTGFTFYARMAPLADCSRFTPPRGTEGLCERRGPAGRPNANWYIFSASPPAFRLYGVPPYPLTDADPEDYEWRGEALTRRFATQVLVHQPLDYLASVAEGLANYVVPRTGRPSVFEYDHEKLVAQLHNPRIERVAQGDISGYYSTGAGFARRNVDDLDAYANFAETEGLVIALLALLAAAGLALARGPTRDAAMLTAGGGFALALLPVAILFYDARYATPVVALLACAAAIGADRLSDLLTPPARRLGGRLRARARAAPTQALLVLLAAGGLVRLALIALTPGEYYDLSAIAIVGEAFADSPLHAYDVNIGAGDYQGTPTYQWPYPPAFLPLAGALHGLSGLLEVTVGKLDRVLVAGADLALALLAHTALARARRSPQECLRAAALIAFAPALIAVSGVHGQIDVIAWLPAVAALVLWEQRADWDRRALACGALIGLGIAVKTTPGLMLLALAPSARDRRELVQLAAAAAAVVLVALAPFLIAAPRGLEAIADYRGFPGRGGLTLLLQPRLALLPFTGEVVQFNDVTHFLLDYAGIIVAAAVLAVATVAWRRRLAPAHAAVALILAVYVASPATLPQYWVWLVPFLVLAGWWRAAVAYGVALLPLLVATYGFLHEPNQLERRLSGDLVLYGYVPLMWLLWLAMLAALIVVLRSTPPRDDEHAVAEVRGPHPLGDAGA